MAVTFEERSIHFGDSPCVQSTISASRPVEVTCIVAIDRGLEFLKSKSLMISESLELKVNGDLVQELLAAHADALRRLKGSAARLLLVNSEGGVAGFPQAAITKVRRSPTDTSQITLALGPLSVTVDDTMTGHSEQAHITRTAAIDNNVSFPVWLSEASSAIVSNPISESGIAGMFAYELRAEREHEPLVMISPDVRKAILLPDGIASLTHIRVLWRSKDRAVWLPVSKWRGLNAHGSGDKNSTCLQPMPKAQGIAQPECTKSSYTLRRPSGDLVKTEGATNGLSRVVHPVQAKVVDSFAMLLCDQAGDLTAIMCAKKACATKPAIDGMIDLAPCPDVSAAVATLLHS